MYDFLKNLKNTIIKENEVFLIFIFIIFGFYGAATDSGTSEKLLYLFLPIIVIFIFLFTKKNDEIIIKIESLKNNLFSKENGLVFISFFLIFLFLSWNKIFMSIADDEYAYTNVGLAHSILLTTKFSKKFDLFQNLKISTLIHFLSLACLFFIFLISIFVIFFKKNFIFKLFTIFFLLFTIRILIF